LRNATADETFEAQLPEEEALEQLAAFGVLARWVEAAEVVDVQVDDANGVLGAAGRDAAGVRDAPTGPPMRLYDAGAIAVTGPPTAGRLRAAPPRPCRSGRRS
jgi:hypothetical protein